MNKVILTGNLASDPEGRTTQSGVHTCSFRLAVQRSYKNASGGYDADFLPVVAWRQTADFCTQYLTKGRKVAVSGSIQVRDYTAQDGSKRYVTEIIADSVEALTPAHAQGDGRPAEAPNTAPAAEGPDDFIEVDDDGLPF